jgi:hypothetical protein
MFESNVSYPHPKLKSRWKSQKESRIGQEKTRLLRAAGRAKVQLSAALREIDGKQWGNPFILLLSVCI